MAALARLQHECWSPCDPGSSRPFGSTNLGIRDDLDTFRWNRCLSTPMLVTWTALLKFESMKKKCGAIALAYVRMRSRLAYWYWFVWVWQYLWSWPLCFFAGIPGSVLMVIEHFTTDDVPRHNRRTVKPMEARLQWTGTKRFLSFSWFAYSLNVTDQLDLIVTKLCFCVERFPEMSCHIESWYRSERLQWCRCILFALMPSWPATSRSGHVVPIHDP